MIIWEISKGKRPNGSRSGLIEAQLHADGFRCGIGAGVIAACASLS